MDTKKITIEKLKAIFVAKKYVWDAKFNMIGIRTSDNTPDVFNDWMVCVVNDKIMGVWEWTTDAGVYWLNNPTRLNGTAILIQGQYLNSWAIGVHKNYEAFVQIKTLKCWRDGNKDDILDYVGTIYTDGQGINIHRGHETWLSKNASWLLKIIKVDKYSAGCQVSAFADNLTKLLNYAKLSSYKEFTYTLLIEVDFN